METMIHLLCGPSGAGKTTLAKKIHLEKQAVPLLIDKCLEPLSIPLIRDWAFAQTVLKKAEQCAAKILTKAEELLAQHNDVVLDIATFRRSDRDSVRAWAKRINSQLILYYVYAGRTARWNRVMNRNVKRGDTYSFDIPQWWFELAESVFEPPSEDEAAILVNNDDVG
jgi:predicted kinase